MLTLEHIEQEIGQIRTYLRTRGKPNVAHDHLRNALTALEFLTKRVRELEPTTGKDTSAGGEA